jgi:hypothetical protein
MQKKGVAAINDSLTNKTPVIVGVNWNSQSATQGESSYNDATEHCITIVGANVDAKGQYYTIFDSGTRYDYKGYSLQNRLYLNSDGTLSGTSVYNQSTKPVITHPEGMGARAAGKCRPLRVRRMAWRARWSAVWRFR